MCGNETYRIKISPCRKCAADAASFSCTICSRKFGVYQALNAHRLVHRVHLQAISREKSTAILSTQIRNRNERGNKSPIKKPVESEFDAANSEDFEEAPDSFEEATGEPGMVNTSHPPNEGCPNVVAGTDPEEDDDIQFVGVTHAERRRSARIPNTNSAGAKKKALDMASAATAKTCKHNVPSEPAGVSANGVIVKNGEQQR